MDSTPTPTILLLSLPPSALAGIDLLSFTTTPLFQGIKHLPPGPHLVFTAPHATLALRHGAWLFVPPPSAGPVPLAAKRWSAEHETLVPERDAAALLRHAANLGSIWRAGLAPYRQSSSSADAASLAPEDDGWARLASRVTPAYLARVFGSAAQDAWHVGTYSDRAPGDGGADADADAPLCFVPLDLRRTWAADSTGRERTEAARDWSWYLASVAETGVVLAEMQFSFLTGLALGNAVAVEQWRALVRLVLGCRKAVGEMPGFYVEVLGVLEAQLGRLVGDMEKEGEQVPQREQRQQLLMEEQSEAQLLAYDLPVRTRARKKVDPMAAPEWGKDPDLPALPAQDSLASLFLDLDVVDGQSTSFLHDQLIRFRQGLEHLTGNSEVQPVMRALAAVEATLFEGFGWEFDAPVDGVGNGLVQNDDDDDNEDGEYAPAVVELSQAELDALGISGTPSGVSRSKMDAGKGTARSDDMKTDLAALRGGGMSRVVVEGSDDESLDEQDDPEEEEEWDDTVNIEDLDARY